MKDVQEAARALGQQIRILNASSERELETVFATLAPSRAGALLVGSDPYFNTRRDQIIALAARHAIPAIYEWREFAVVGGLMSYGTILTDARRVDHLCVYRAAVSQQAPGNRFSQMPRRAQRTKRL